jgi:hypothetical protein
MKNKVRGAFIVIKAFEFSQPISGVQVKPMAHDGSKVSILYNGALSQETKDLYLHFGFGAGVDWIKVGEHPMQKTPGGWLANISMMGDQRLNFCFKDSSQKWDNNSGYNWSYLIN